MIKKNYSHSYNNHTITSYNNGYNIDLDINSVNPPTVWIPSVFPEMTKKFPKLESLESYPFIVYRISYKKFYNQR